jgi:hypothetical protein
LVVGVIVSVQNVALVPEVVGDAVGKLAYAVVLCSPVAPLAVFHVPDDVSLSHPIQYCVFLVTETGVPKVNVLAPDTGFVTTVAEPNTVVGALPDEANIEHFKFPV